MTEQILTLPKVAKLIGVRVAEIELAAQYPGHPPLRWRGRGYSVEGIPSSAIAAWVRYFSAHKHHLETRA